MTDIDERRKLLKIARDSPESAFSGRALDIPDTSRMQGAFVTLTEAGHLRGCIGYMAGIRPLYEQIAELAREAAFSDYRFPPLRAEELPLITIGISLLTAPEPIDSADSFRIGTDGIIMEKSGRRAVFLPQVALETGWTKEEMLSALSEKAGLRSDDWQEGASFMTFQAEEFSEDSL